MWPKMLIELLPHFVRLVPVADRFLASRSASDSAQEAALATLSESVRGNLGQLSELHSGVQRALKEQSTQVNEIAVEVTRARLGIESTEARVGALERSIETRLAALEEKSVAAMRLLAVAMVMLLGTAALVVFVLFRLLHR